MKGQPKRAEPRWDSWFLVPCAIFYKTEIFMPNHYFIFIIKYLVKLTVVFCAVYPLPSTHYPSTHVGSDWVTWSSLSSLQILHRIDPPLFNNCLQVREQLISKSGNILYSTWLPSSSEWPVFSLQVTPWWVNAYGSPTCSCDSSR